MLYFVLRHGNERNITPELANALREAVNTDVNLSCVRIVVLNRLRNIRNFHLNILLTIPPLLPILRYFKMPC